MQDNGERKYSVLERVFLVLNALAQRTDQTMETEQLLMLPPYTLPNLLVGDATAQDTARHRLMSDIDRLIARGMVVRVVPRGHADTGRPQERSAIRLKVPTKPMSLSLTPDEHAVLRRARADLRPGVPEPTPLATNAASTDTTDRIARVLRYLEEHPGPVAARQLGEDLGLPAKQIGRFLLTLGDLDQVSDYALGVALDYGEDDDDDSFVTDGTDIVSVELISPRETVRSRSPLAGSGLGNVGRFAYTAEETRERLSLVDEAERSWARPDSRDADLLWHVRMKLRAWLELLEQSPPLND